MCAALLDATGRSYRVVAAHGGEPLPEPTGFSAVIVLGGEMGVYQTREYPFLERVGELMRKAVSEGVPLLGICLGGQLLAQALGGKVSSPSPNAERGILEVTLTGEGERDPLFYGLSTSFTTFQQHNDSFSLPGGAVLLAISRACPVQAFRFGKNAYGVQFHPEVDRAIVSRWAAFPPLEPDLVPQFEAFREQYEESSTRFLINFISLAASPVHS